MVENKRNLASINVYKIIIIIYKNDIFNNNAYAITALQNNLIVNTSESSK